LIAHFLVRRNLSGCRPSGPHPHRPDTTALATVDSERRAHIGWARGTTLRPSSRSAQPTLRSVGCSAARVVPGSGPVRCAHARRPVLPGRPLLPELPHLAPVNTADAQRPAERPPPDRLLPAPLVRVQAGPPAGQPSAGVETDEAGLGVPDHPEQCIPLGSAPTAHAGTDRAAAHRGSSRSSVRPPSSGRQATVVPAARTRIG